MAIIAELKGVRTVRTPLQGGFCRRPNTEILIPARQDSIQFQEKPLVVVRLPDGQPGVVLRWACENLLIVLDSQAKDWLEADEGFPRDEHT